jgi:NitT/TauT family transport system ATP-binding protein
VLEAIRASKSFKVRGRPIKVLSEVSLRVDTGEFVAIVGPSGCGKTTLLRCLAGLIPLGAGEVRFEDEVLTSTPPELAVVFQDYSRSLFPWLSAHSNVMLPLRRLGLSRAERRQRAQEALAEVALGEVGDRYPWQLSGGMQQRVAIARAIAYRPRVLLMDEPFASVDAQTRSELQDMILRLHRSHEMTSIFVTHDIDEAIYLSERIHVLGAAPARVVDVIDVNLPPERDQVGTKAHPEFQMLRSVLWDLLAKREPSELAAGSVEK